MPHTQTLDSPPAELTSARPGPAKARNAPKFIGVDTKVKDRDEQEVELLGVAGVRVSCVLARPLCPPTAARRLVLDRRVNRILLANELEGDE
jgi:hypothetical protein